MISAVGIYTRVVVWTSFLPGMVKAQIIQNDGYDSLGNGLSVALSLSNH